MGKYFSNNSDFSNYNIEQNKENNLSVIPSTDNLTRPLSDATKQKLSRTPSEAINEDDYINLIKEQTENVSDMITKYSEESKEELKNQFKKFQPLELFEKINQLIFVVAQLSNRITSLENSIKGIKEEEKQIEKISDPADLYKFQQNEEILSKINSIPKNIPQVEENQEKEKIDINELKKQINAAKSGKKLPHNEYTDNSIKLEEVFPNLDDEAYQAAYASSMRKEKNKSSATEKKPIPGKMKGITGF